MRIMRGIRMKMMTEGKYQNEVEKTGWYEDDDDDEYEH
jgi:hypothetical protein